MKEDGALQRLKTVNLGLKQVNILFINLSILSEHASLQKLLMLFFHQSGSLTHPREKLLFRQIQSINIHNHKAI